MGLNLITMGTQLVPSKSNKAAGITCFLPVMPLKEDFEFLHVRSPEVTAAIHSFAIITKFKKSKCQHAGTTFGLLELAFD